MSVLNSTPAGIQTISQVEFVLRLGAVLGILTLTQPLSDHRGLCVRRRDLPRPFRPRHQVRETHPIRNRHSIVREGVQHRGLDRRHRQRDPELWRRTDRPSEFRQVDRRVESRSFRKSVARSGSFV